MEITWFTDAIQMSERDGMQVCQKKKGEGRMGHRWMAATGEREACEVYRDRRNTVL